MILNDKKKHHKHHSENCDCHPRKYQRYDSETHIVPLEEHFENFADSVVEVAENFLRGKKGKERQAKRIERKEQRKDVRQEKRISRIQTRQGIRENKLTKLTDADAQQKAIADQKLQASQQADQVNQLQSQVQPTAQPVSSSMVPQGSGDTGGQYQTLPEYTPPTTSGLTGMSGGSGGSDFALEQEQPEEATAKVTDTKGPEEQPKKKSNAVLYIVIVAVVIGAIYLMKKK